MLTAGLEYLMQRIIVAAGNIVGDIGAVPGDYIQKSGVLKVLYRKVDRGLVYSRALGKLTFGRKLLSGGELAREYLRLYILKKTFLRRGDAYFFKSHNYYRLRRFVID